MCPYYCDIGLLVLRICTLAAYCTGTKLSPVWIVDSEVSTAFDTKLGMVMYLLEGTGANCGGPGEYQFLTYRSGASSFFVGTSTYTC